MSPTPAGAIAERGGGAAPYQRHRPEHTLLYQIVEQYYPAFAALMAEQERPLPDYVQQEFEDYLRCGRLEHGFLRVRCDTCHAEHLVAFSCNRRGFCPSCGARRMVESAAHLVDHVFPEVAVRQWVLTFPFPLRFLLAAQPEALTQVLAVVQRGISTFVIQHAGLTVSSGARTGAVTLIQRRRWKAGGFPARERSALGMPSRVLRLGPEPEPPSAHAVPGRGLRFSRQTGGLPPRVPAHRR